VEEKCLDTLLEDESNCADVTSGGRSFHVDVGNWKGLSSKVKSTMPLWGVGGMLISLS